MIFPPNVGNPNFGKPIKYSSNNNATYIIMGSRLNQQSHDVKDSSLLNLKTRSQMFIQIIGNYITESVLLRRRNEGTCTLVVLLGIGCVIGQHGSHPQVVRKLAEARGTGYQSERCENLHMQRIHLFPSAVEATSYNLDDVDMESCISFATQIFESLWQARLKLPRQDYIPQVASNTGLQGRRFFFRTPEKASKGSEHTPKPDILIFGGCTVNEQTWLEKLKTRETTVCEENASMLFSSQKAGCSNAFVMTSMHIAAC
eukprot:3808188-Amphidinium_carterae.1